ncbi:MAG: valine--tRNA ligase [Candidatus Neomarinimicrobiota bacterium]|nr:MAG: valine--tRNA ligase [Candidatus Neomarinimicrobiota bacterium]
MPELEKVYRPAQIEDRWYATWLEKGYFSARPNPHKTPYTIVIPPPNVTGMLTMGHVLNNTIQDILIRKARMEGKEACWIPGTDHASIATEAKVVKMLAEQGIAKEDLSREEFLKHAWEWKEKYGGIIISQLKKLGCSCDWDRERFTMDPGYSRAVLEAFVRLYHKGWIYRGHRLVNWCPVSRSAISDEEVIHREVQGHLWYLQYDVVDSEEKVTVATTRPETMLGDTAIAVHPDDDRFRHLVGKTVRLPLVGRLIPVIADSFVDPEFGTGCVKVTPAHDPNDFAMGETHDLEFVQILNEDATLNDNVPEPYRGLSREEARKQVVEDLQREGRILKIEDYTHKVGFSERGQVPIEYYFTEQWFLRMEELARPALEAVNSGRIRFHPDHWVKTFNHWMENIRDWCISRQLWWGHRIPVWYRGEEVYCGVEPPVGEGWEQDPDVLDTWASSWLWPLGVHDWPEESDDLSYFYPTDTLVTGPDIIFFWVARMIMAGLEFRQDIPFRDVYFTSILRDEQGRKFSKSLGNSPNPFDLFDQYGTDAVRFGIMLMAPQGLDVLFTHSRLEVGRNFMNKLWNASRFVLMNLPDGLPWPLDLPPSEELDLPERWILSRFQRAIQRLNRNLERFHFNEGAKVIYEFTWNDFCDWYVEIAKTRFRDPDSSAAETARKVAVVVLRGIAALLHPYAPFITEELWSHLKQPDEPDLIVAPWPQVDPSRVDDQGERDLALIQETITSIRTIRGQMNVPPQKKGRLAIRANASQIALLEGQLDMIRFLGSVDGVAMDPQMERPPQAATAVVQGMELFLPLEGLIDIAVEKKRLEKRKRELEGHVQSLRRKLDNDQFLTRAPEAVVAKERQKLTEMTEELSKLAHNLELLE